MRNRAFASFFIISMLTGQAFAHPGATILTTSSGERTAMTQGVSFEETNSVHVFRGAPRQNKNELAGADNMSASMPPAVKHTRHRPYRQFKGLRTQGFYSGNNHPSRPYTQGFYSGN